MTLTLGSHSRCFGGTLTYYRHYSESCHQEMGFSIFEPPQAKIKAVQVVYYLSGLTCTENNFTVKAGAQRYAAELGLFLVAPDTSPRNTGTSAASCSIFQITIAILLTLSIARNPRPLTYIFKHSRLHSSSYPR